MASDYGETLQGLASLVNAFGNLMEPSEAELRREERDFQAKQFEASQKFALYQGQANRIQNQITSTETAMMDQWGSLPPVDQTPAMQDIANEINSGNYSALETVQKQAELARLELNRLNFANATVQGLRQFERNLVSQYPEIAGSDFDLNTNEEWDRIYTDVLSKNGSFTYGNEKIESIEGWREHMKAYYNPSSKLEKYAQGIPLYDLQEKMTMTQLAHAQESQLYAQESHLLNVEKTWIEIDQANFNLYTDTLAHAKAALGEAAEQVSSMLVINAGEAGVLSFPQMVALAKQTTVEETSEAANKRLDEIYESLIAQGMDFEQVRMLESAISTSAGGNDAALRGIIFDVSLGESNPWSNSIGLQRFGNREILLNRYRSAYMNFHSISNSYNERTGEIDMGYGEQSTKPFQDLIDRSAAIVQANKVNYTKKNPNTLTLQNGTILNFDTGEAYDPLYNQATKPSATEWNSLLQNDLNNNKNANYQVYFKEISPVATANDPFAKENSEYQKFLSGGFDGVLPNMDMLSIMQTVILDPRSKGFNKRVKAFGETTYEELENQIANMSFRDIADGLEMNKFVMDSGYIPTIGGLRSNLERTLAKKLNTGGKWFPTYRGLSDEKKALVDGIVDKLIEKYERTVTRFWNGIDDPVSKRLVLDMVGQAQSNFSAVRSMRGLNDELNAKKSAEEGESSQEMEALLRELEEKSQQDGNYTPPKKTKQESENEDRQLPVRPQGKTLGATQTNPQNTNIAEYLSIFNKNLTQRV